jgi:malate synthase
MSEMTYRLPEGLEIIGNYTTEFNQILTSDALAFVAKLQREFNQRRITSLKKRVDRQTEIDAGKLPDFLPKTKHIRENKSWRVASTPDDLQDRRVEITGPVERKMMINALNSGAKVFMADFEDANSPTWTNMIEGQINLRDAIDRTISFTSPDGKKYSLNEKIATLMVRPRGWHLNEKHVSVDGEQVSGSLFDFGLFFYHNARTLLDSGSGPYFYLPKLENHLEARLWNDVFLMAQRELGIPAGSIRATVLIENILVSFEMEEILFELKQHSAGLNAGRWDYIFSVIKKFRNQPDFVLPDRERITMTVPFMRAYTELLVKTCHHRGAHAIGGMAAFIPSRKDPEINRVALVKVREDKDRESNDGFDGTWVAHPDLVPTAMEEFDRFLGDNPHQKERLREEVNVTAQDLLNFEIKGGEITEKGFRHNMSVAILYIASWLRGTGAAALFNLMEDAATAEISRAQVWQWINHENARLSDGRQINLELYHRFQPEEMEKIKGWVGEDFFKTGKFHLAAKIFDDLVTDKIFTEFLTFRAYEELE